MKIAVIIVRILMGIMFALASIVVLFHLVPTTPKEPVSDEVMQFQQGIVASHYLLPTLKIFELLCAICFLSGYFVPLATVVIFPATLNILLYHAFVDPKELLLAILLMIGNIFLAYHYRKSYGPLFVPK